MDVKRRTFMTALGLTAASTVLPGCEKEVRQLVPYLLPDDEIVPGMANWYASTCGECNAGCGIIVRVMEGRAKKIEGNPDHPLNQGKLCARGQAALQRLYNPDRLRGPLHRTIAGPNGSLESTSWEEALGQLAEQLRKSHGHVLMVSRPLSGTLAELLWNFIRSVGGQLMFHEPSAELALRLAAQRGFGIRGIPHYDLAQSDHLLSFGAPLLEPWLSPVSFGIAFGAMRQGRSNRRGRFIQVEPRLSLTAASADRWVPIRPGAEGLLALGIGQLLLIEGGSRLPKSQRTVYERFYRRISLEDVATQSDIPLQQIEELAGTFAKAEHPLAIGGGPACAHTNAYETQMAIQGLNALVGNINESGGVRFYHSSPAAHPDIPRLSEHRLGEMVQRIDTRGERPLLLLYDCNPLFDIPPSIPVRRLFERASFIASFSSCLDESNALADVILPDHSRLETWGDHVQDQSSPREIASLIQPAVMPLYETRAFGDTILDLSRLLFPGTTQAGTFAQDLKLRWQNPLHASHTSRAKSQTPSSWEECLQQGGWWAPREVEQKLTFTFPSLSLETAEFDGAITDYPFFFYPYPSSSLGNARGANLPWLQELPDTMTSAVWGTWAEINPATAQSLGIRQGDLLRIHSCHGSLDAPALVYPGLRPDVIAMPIGQGHTNYGRYADQRGTNPLSILAPLFDRESGALAMGATRVRVEPLKAPGELVLLERPGANAGNELLSIERSR